MVDEFTEIVPSVFGPFIYIHIYIYIYTYILSIDFMDILKGNYPKLSAPCKVYDKCKHIYISFCRTKYR